MQVSIFDHDLFDEEPFTEREAWLWMITKAAWSETRHRVGSKVHVVPVGSFFITLREMQEVFKWKSDKKVRGLLSLLERENMINVKTDAGKTQVTICNYSKYQDAGRSGDAAGTQRGRTKDTNTPIYTSSLRSEDISLVEKKSEKNGSRIPEDFRPDLEWSQKQGLKNSELKFEFEQFKDYWTAKSGKDATKKDWQATWRQWIRNSVKRRNGKNNRPMSIGEAAAAASAERKRNEQQSIFDTVEQQQGDIIGYNRTARKAKLPALPPISKQ